jgi:hypothetical protein
MGSFHTTLFDTWQPSTTANAETLLFQVPRGGDSTHNERFTNARGAGQLPAGEKFTINNIGLMADQNFTDADWTTGLYGALLEVRVMDKIVFSAPARRCFTNSSYGGHFTQATAADAEVIGPNGDGFILSVPIVIPGGVRFDVRLVQGSALAATRSVKCILEGILDLPD